MDDQTKSELKVILEERASALLSEIEAARDSAKPVDLGESIGRLARMDAIQNQQIAMKTKAEKEKSLSLVKSALKRLPQEDFGECIDCGGPIELKRLKHRPESVMCLSCQSERETQ